MKARDWDARYADWELVWGVEPNRFVAAELAGLTPGRAVDLACGEGRNAVWLAERGWRVTAVDFSAVGVDKARRIAEHRGVDVDLVVADLLEWVPEPGGYDLALLCYLQIPAADRAVIWARAAAAVAPGGTFFVVGHDSRNLADGHGGPQSPDVLYTAADVLPFLDGFDVVQAAEVLRPVPLDDGTTATAIDCLVHAVRRP